MLDSATLLERHINACGGLDAIEKIKTLYQSGTATDRNGDVFTLESWRKRPDMLRLQFSINAATGTEAWDGRHGWQYVPWQHPEPALVGGEAMEDLRRSAAFDGPLIHARRKGHSVKSLGECIVAGLPVYGLRVILQDGSVIDHYLHKESYMIAATDSVRPAHVPTDSVTTTMYTDYRLVAGVMFAYYSVEVTQDGAKNRTFAWRELAANLPVEDGFFALPKIMPSEN